VDFLNLQRDFKEIKIYLIISVNLNSAQDFKTTCKWIFINDFPEFNSKLIECIGLARLLTIY